MTFDFKFLDNEIRDNYLIPAYMKRAWAAELEVLMGIDRVCKEHDIKYYVDYGTLLGAVRHHGFIPWDDDIDICMFRKDYDRFCEIMRDIQEDLILRDIHNDENYQQYFCRIVNTNKFELTEEYLEKYHGFPYVVGVDIFPLDNIPDDESEKEKYKSELSDILNVFLLLLKGYGLEFLNPSITIIEKRYGISINRKKDLRNQLFKIFERVSRKYNNQETREVADIYEWWRDNTKVRKKSWYIETIELEFENTRVLCPKEYHNVLTCLYGDYKEPVLIADGHEFPFYDKVEKLLIEKNIKPYYSYEKPADNTRDALINSQTSYKRMSMYVDLLKRINESVINLYSNGNYSGIKELIENSQLLAIKIGNILESCYFNEDVSASIKEIEDYCEKLYLIFGDIDNNDGVSFVDHFKGLLEILGTIIISISKIESIAEPKRIAFVFDRIEDWERYRNIIDILKNGDNKIFVTPIPYYEKDNNARISKEHYIGDMIAQDIDIVDYCKWEELDITFDIIVTANPYDNMCLSSSINPFFYAKNLQKYTKKIVHIPSFEIMDFDANCTQMVSMMRYYVKTPGVVNADYVFVKSEKMKERYIEALREFTGRNNWNERVINYKDDEEIVRNLLEL